MSADASAAEGGAVAVHRDGVPAGRAGARATVQRLIAARVARHLTAGQVVNLGIGIPTLVPDCLPGGCSIVVHTENGLLGVGPSPRPDESDPHLVNAGKVPVTALPGASYFDSALSFAMIRGGHVDVAVLGTLQVDRAGRIANWAVPGRAVLGVGGAMDLLAGARRVIIATTHLTWDGRPKLVDRCSYPLTSDRPADLIVTERATFAVADGRLVLVETASGTTPQWLARHTAAPFTTPADPPPAGPDPDPGPGAPSAPARSPAPARGEP